MRSVVLFIAVSVDGYIADTCNSVNWIKGQDDSAEMKDTYSEFFDTIDTIVMGNRTYKQIVTELSPDTWPYSGAKTYVITHSPMSATRDIVFSSEDPCSLVENLRNHSGKDIWICGGADVVNQLLKKDLIDRFHIATIPVMTGGGVRLFEETGHSLNLRMVDTITYNGVVETVYERRLPRCIQLRKR